MIIKDTVSEIMLHATRESAQQISDTILSALRRYIPDATDENLGAWYRRIRVIEGASTGHYLYYIDYATPNEQLFLEILPMETGKVIDNEAGYSVLLTHKFITH